jgi:hypothetical protein
MDRLGSQGQRFGVDASHLPFGAENDHSPAYRGQQFFQIAFSLFKISDELLQATISGLEFETTSPHFTGHRVEGILKKIQIPTRSTLPRNS